ncbi:metallophosphoesterase [Arcticibacter svalbardensis MN12-7]|uniref:Metallophosphoesterase n=1 Tax=Arcticibacter svalbardensis MN12-7 TaxID=1150600 RepID=R9GVR4_9SPHI|nr:metallophosphatase domain-containing protein [Arcticibacter svalbardensis]EOR93024.1 metallophosphoesterase [Arcticibacter svalbardensis MN12-7]
MKIIAISDTHGKHRLLRNLPQADMIIHAGDVSRDGSEHSTLDFMNWFSSLDYKYKIFIAGNHDFFFEQEMPNYIKKLIPGNLTYLNDSGVTIEGIRIWGSPITPRFFDWAFNRDRGKEINKHWKLIPKDTDLLITHGPPKGILDLVGLNEMVGCDDLLKRVKLVKPKVHIFGHIHGAYGAKELKSTRFINASIVDEGYMVCNSPVLIEL